MEKRVWLQYFTKIDVLYQGNINNGDITRNIKLLVDLV